MRLCGCECGSKCDCVRARGGVEGNGTGLGVIVLVDRGALVGCPSFEDDGDRYAPRYFGRVQG